MSTLKDLLVDKDQILIVNPKLATEVGLNEAVFLQQLDYWINIKKRAASAGENVAGYAEGRFWVFKTLSPVSAQKAQRMRENNRTVIGSWQDEFPWWSLSTIRRIIASLVDKRLVLKGNFNRLKMDKTLWLTIDYTKLESTLIDKNSVQNEQMRNDAVVQNEQMHNVASVQNEQIDVSNLSVAIPETTKPEITVFKDDDDSNNVKPRRVRDANVEMMVSVVSDKLLSNGINANEAGIKDRLYDVYSKVLKTDDFNRISELSIAAIDRTMASTTVKKSFVGYFLKILGQLLQRLDIHNYDDAMIYLTGSDRIRRATIAPTELVTIPTDVDILNTDWSQFR